MKHTDVDSSNIRSTAYDHATGMLEVVFRNGDRWRYTDVPPEKYARLIRSESPGGACVEDTTSHLSSHLTMRARAPDACVDPS